MSKLLERCMRGFWGPRWNGIAHAEFLRSCDRGMLSAVIAVLVLAYGGALAALIWIPSFRAASAVIRGIVWVVWLLGVVVATVPVQRMFTLDANLDVSESWLLTSERRRDVLWARTLGRSAAAPLLICLAVPLYVVGAAGLSGAQYALFAVGHLARLVTLGPAPVSVSVAGLAAALPVAALAVLGDLAACHLSACGALSGALQAVSGKRFWRDFARSVTQSLELTIRNLGLTLLLIFVEGFCAALAGIWCGYSWELGDWGTVVIGLAVAAVVTSTVVFSRWRAAEPCVGIAARSHDAILLEDGHRAPRD